MGRGRSYEIVEYRDTIINIISNDEIMAKLLGYADVEEAQDMLYDTLFPHEFLPDVQTTAKRYVAFDIQETLDPRNKTFRDLKIYFYIGCHIDRIKYKETDFVDANGKKGSKNFLWYDRMVMRIDELFNNENVFGVGNLTLERNYPYTPQNVFRGRMLVFSISDFTNNAKYGK